MKKVKTIAMLMVCYVCSVCAQEARVDSALVWRYAELSYSLGGKSKVAVDYGDQAVVAWFKKPELLKDEQGQDIKFKSPVDALNWMSLRGWELVQSYVYEDNQGVGVRIESVRFIMRRRE